MAVYHSVTMLRATVFHLPLHNPMRAMAVSDNEMSDYEYDEPPFVDILNDVQVKIFPNPTRGHLAIEIADNTF